MKSRIITSVRFLMVMTLLTGIIYPVFVTVVSTAIFPGKAKGSIISIGGKISGSELIGQKFESDKYFWPRPSATSYNALPSGGSNLGPTSDSLRKLVDLRRRTFLAANGLSDLVNIPTEMLFASGSGLDPHISPESALLQVDRVVNSRKLNPDQKSRVILLVSKLTEKRQFTVLGEERVNVLKLNIELDKLTNSNNY